MSELFSEVDVERKGLVDFEQFLLTLQSKIGIQGLFRHDSCSFDFPGGMIVHHVVFLGSSKVMPPKEKSIFGPFCEMPKRLSVHESL